MNAIYAVAGILIALLPLAPPASAQHAAETVRIRIVRDGPSELIDRATEAILGELRPLLGDSLAIEVEDGDWTLPEAGRLFARAAGDSDADVVVTIGALSAHAVAVTETPIRPTVLALAGPPLALGLQPDDSRPWVNRAGLLTLDRDLARLTSLVPVRRIGLLIDASAMAGLPRLASAYSQIETATGVTVVPVAIPAEPGGQVDLPADLDAAVLGLLLQVSETQRQSLVEEAARRGLPLVAALEPDDVARGALMTTLPERIWALRGRHVALAVQALLEGVDAAALREPLAPGDRFALNLRVARELGLSPSFSLLSEAEVVGAEATATSGDSAITLGQLAEEVAVSNPGLEAAEQSVEAGASRVRQARSPLLPQLGIEARGEWIDQDRAEGSFPPAERTLSWSAQLSQRIYSPGEIGELQAEQERQDAREAGFVARRLDVLRTAGALYIDLLRTRTAERVQRENLERVRANLHLAEVRVGVGSEGREEIFRWRIELAQSQQEVVRAEAVRRQAEIAVNELRSRPIDTPVVPREMSFRDLEMVAADPRLDGYMTDPRSVEILQAFAVGRALSASPELQALNAELRAAEAMVQTRERSLYVPDLWLEAAVTDRLLEGGTGTEEAFDIPGFPVPDDWDWSVGVVASLPLVTGGGRLARVDEAQANLAQLEAEHRELSLAIEREVRTRIVAANASHRSLALTTVAVEAAEENLVLVRDAYERGTIDLIRLVDAQAQSLVTALAQANASFEFLQDFLAVERALGQLSYGPNALSTDDFFADLAAFAARSTGAQPE